MRRSLRSLGFFLSSCSQFHFKVFVCCQGSANLNSVHFKIFSSQIAMMNSNRTSISPEDLDDNDELVQNFTKVSIGSPGKSPANSDKVSPSVRSSLSSSLFSYNDHIIQPMKSFDKLEPITGYDEESITSKSSTNSQARYPLGKDSQMIALLCDGQSMKRDGQSMKRDGDSMKRDGESSSESTTRDTSPRKNRVCNWYEINLPYLPYSFYSSCH